MNEDSRRQKIKEIDLPVHCRLRWRWRWRWRWKSRLSRLPRKVPAWSVRQDFSKDRHAPKTSGKVAATPACDTPSANELREEEDFVAADTMEIGEPVVLARLPKALQENYQHKHGHVYGLTAGQKKKRHEVSVAVDGHSVNIYEVRGSAEIFGLCLQSNRLSMAALKPPMPCRRPPPLCAAQHRFEYGRESIPTQDSLTSPQNDKAIKGWIALRNDLKMTSHKASTTRAWFCQTPLATSHFSR